MKHINILNNKLLYIIIYCISILYLCIHISEREEIKVCVELISKLFTGVKHLVTIVKRVNKKSKGGLIISFSTI